jgi:hypothetical protein
MGFSSNSESGRRNDRGDRKQPKDTSDHVTSLCSFHVLTNSVSDIPDCICKREQQCRDFPSFPVEQAQRVLQNITQCIHGA